MVLLVVFVKNVLDAERFRGVRRIDDQRPAALRLFDYCIDLSQEHRPAVRLRESGNVKCLGAFLDVDEQRVRELRCEGRLSDAFRAIAG